MWTKQLWLGLSKLIKLNNLTIELGLNLNLLKKQIKIFIKNTCYI